ncbi:MAG: hypothetical protein VW713_00890 [Alphaproteobacteria bacterium]
MRVFSHAQFAEYIHGARFRIVETGQLIAARDLVAFAGTHFDNPASYQRRDLGPGHRLDNPGGIDCLHRRLHGHR